MMDFWERVLNWAGLAFAALIVYSWVYGAIYGRGSAPGSREEYYENMR